jgi:hypothetical protein
MARQDILDSTIGRCGQGTILARNGFLREARGETLMLGTILIIVLILLLIGALPSWPYSSGWGYGPSGLLGTVLVILLVLVLLGRL